MTMIRLFTTKKCKPSSRSLPMIWLCMPLVTSIWQKEQYTAPKKPYRYTSQISPHGLNLLQRLSDELLYSVVVIAHSRPDSRQPVPDSSRIDACRLLCCC